MRIGERGGRKGFCGKHSMRFRRHGDPLAGRTSRGESFLWLKKIVANPPQNCVVWPYGKTTGYGKLQYAGRKILAHRLSLILFTGEEPDGMWATHLPVICHDPACVNPLHLRWASPTQNQADRLEDETSTRGESNGNSELTVEKVLEIREDSRPQLIIALEHGVSRGHVISIKNRHRWGWLKN